MGDSESEKLCARLTGSVGSHAATELYQELNLDKGTVFSEFFFKEMMKIFHYPGMEEWPKVLSSDNAETNKSQGKQSASFHMSLVCFKPPYDTKEKPALIKKRVKLAHKMAREMLCSCFDTAEDHTCIKVAMANHPTIAIFISPKENQDNMKRVRNKNKQLGKSILDAKDPNTSLQCLAAVNYYSIGQQTVVLWLATTVNAPPIDSIHVTWRNLGLATYLLCMLVKQQTIFSTDDTLSGCTLCLQASRRRDNPVRQFYFKLGFQCHDLDDNGIDLLHYSFQMAVAQNPRIWVSPEREAMSLFRLHNGKLSLPQRTMINFTPQLDVIPGSDSNSALSWKSHFYAKFPWPLPSMKTVEGYLDLKPILKGLSGDALPLTDRPLPIQRTVSTLSGQITGQTRTQMNSTSWLCTDEIQFIFAYLLRNPHENRGVFHVLGPMIMHKVSLVYTVMGAILCNKATDEQQSTYASNMEGIQAYIDSRLHIMQHKFLVFICNINDVHWISVVVVNPFLRFDQYLEEGKESNNPGKEKKW